MSESYITTFTATSNNNSPARFSSAVSRSLFLQFDFGQRDVLFALDFLHLTLGHDLGDGGADVFVEVSGDLIFTH